MDNHRQTYSEHQSHARLWLSKSPDQTVRAAALYLGNAEEVGWQIALVTMSWPGCTPVRTAG